MGQHAQAIREKHTARNVTLIVLAVLVVLSHSAGCSVCNCISRQKASRRTNHKPYPHYPQSMTLQSSRMPPRRRRPSRRLSSRRQAKQIAHGSLWNVAAKMPFVGSDIATVQGMTEVVDNLAQQTLPSLTTAVQQLADANLSGAEGQLNLQPIADAQGNFDKLNQQVQQQNKQYNSLAEPKIGMVKKAYQQGKDQLGQYRRSGRTGQQRHSHAAFLPRPGTVPAQACWRHRPHPEITFRRRLGWFLSAP